MAYCTIQDIRDEGVTEAEASDARLTATIALAGQYIDLVTRRFFEARPLTLALDGSGDETLFLPVPIISVESVTDCGEVIPLDKLVIYNRRFPDDRGNPRIVCRSRSFSKGSQNVELTGIFGYTDDGDVTPALIEQAAVKLVIREVAPLADSDAQAEKKRARIVSETTDKHSYTLGQLASSGEWTGDPEIDNMLYFYKAPPVVHVV